jgi:hypothetical protein
MANWALWRLIFGRMWTEYSLYYLTARCTNIFDQYHVHYTNISSSRFFPALNLYGFSIWSSNDWTTTNQQQLVNMIEHGLQWRRQELEQAHGQAINDTSRQIRALFTILQGRHNVNPEEYHQLLYPIYIRYLKQRNETKTLVELLNTMTGVLIKL